MIPGARYGHTNLIARDWRRLADFYEACFGCVPVPPERDYRGRDLERGTGLRGAALHGVHLRLPDHGVDGPTLEIYTYEALENASPPAVNRPGWGTLHSQWMTSRRHATRCCGLAGIPSGRS